MKMAHLTSLAPYSEHLHGSPVPKKESLKVPLWVMPQIRAETASFQRQFVSKAQLLNRPASFMPHLEALMSVLCL